MKYDPRFLEGIERFNRQEFFEAHQIWEEVWLEQKQPTKDFFKGLIQIAIGLHHFRNGNTRGIRKLYFSSRKYLGTYPDQYHGIDIARLLTDMVTCCSEVAGSEEHTPTVQFIPERAPMLELQGAGASED